jgi:hypothetical protein
LTSATSPFRGTAKGGQHELPDQAGCDHDLPDETWCRRSACQGRGNQPSQQTRGIAAAAQINKIFPKLYWGMDETSLLVDPETVACGLTVRVDIGVSSC